MMDVDPASAPKIWPLLWREKYLIVVSVLVMIVLAFLYVHSATKVYQATGDLQVNLTTSTPGSSDVTASNQADAQNYATLIVSPGFLSTIRARVDGGRHSVAGLQEALSATAQTNSALVELNANGPSPAAAQQLAQQVMSGFVAFVQTSATARTNQLQAQVNSRIEAVERQIASLSGTPGSAAQISSLNSEKNALLGQSAILVANGLAQGTSVTESAAPVAGLSPISPKKSLDLIAGLLLGLLLGVAIAWIRQALRPAFQSAQDVSSSVDQRLLATIPLSRSGGEDPLVIEAYRVLEANLRLSMRRTDGRIAVVLGVDPQVGKTSTVEGLARVASADRGRTLIVDGDMRAATLSERFGCKHLPGLTDILQGVISVQQAVREVGPNLWILPTRPAVTNAASLLSGNRMFTAFHAMREQFDMVVVDSPPLTGLADGLLLGAEADTVVVVVRTGVTKPSTLAAGVGMLISNRIPISGLVVFDEVDVEPYYLSAQNNLSPVAGVATTP
ncbi:MAG: AAA family ATPase [Solirubrobacteraceae bacterium]